MDIHQLLISKYLFKHGQEVLSKRDFVSFGLAISLFQDSAEILLWSIAKFVEADIKEKEAFMNYWNKIENARSNIGNKRLPFKAKMLELNKARVNFKHHGQIPTQTDAVKYESYTEDFLRDAMQSFLNVNFDNISLAALIVNKEVRELLEQAEAVYKNKDITECITACSKAAYLVSSQLNRVIPPVDHRLAHIRRYESSFSDNRLLSEFMRECREGLSYVHDYLDVLRKLSIASILNINSEELNKFHSIVPDIGMTAGGEFRILLDRQHAYTEEQAKFCIDFVTKYAILTQNRISSS